MNNNRVKKALESILVRGIAIIVLGFFVMQIVQAAPPLDFPGDGHDVDAVLATGSVISINSANPGPNPAVVDLFKNVAQFHSEITSDVGGETCLACHSGILQQETLLRKMPQKDGSIEVIEETNHHRIHAKREIVDFGTDCTFCHNEFQVAQDDLQVTISGYVEKTTCANCHSAFTPRGLMDPTWKDLFGCPGCHQDTVPDTHQKIEISKRYVIDDAITGVDCFTCHSDNPFQLPQRLQDLYWQNVVIDF